MSVRLVSVTDRILKMETGISIHFLNNSIFTVSSRLFFIGTAQIIAKLLWKWKNSYELLKNTHLINESDKITFLNSVGWEIEELHTLILYEFDFSTCAYSKI